MLALLNSKLAVVSLCTTSPARTLAVVIVTVLRIFVSVGCAIHPIATHSSCNELFTLIAGRGPAMYYILHKPTTDPLLGIAAQRLAAIVAGQLCTFKGNRVPDGVEVEQI